VSGSPPHPVEDRGASAPLWTAFARAVRTGAVVREPLAGRAVAFDALLSGAERTATQVLHTMAVDGTVAADRLPSRLGLLMANGEPWLRALFSAFRLGAAVVPLATPATSSDLDAYCRHLRRIATDADLDAILIDDSVRRVAPALRAGLPGLPVIDVADVPAQPASADLPGAPEATGTAIVQYTSGSTSAPKGVVLSHRNVLAGLTSLAVGAEWTDGDSMGMWLPLFHDMGLFLTLSALLHGSPVTLWRPSDFIRRNGAWLQSFAASRTTAAPAPNFAYDYLVRRARQDGVPDGVDLSAWRLAYNGAEPVHAATIEEFQATFGRYGFRPEAMFPCYGLAEATLAVTFPTPGRPPRYRHLDRTLLDPGERVRDVPAGAPQARAVVALGHAAPGLRLRVAAGDTPLAGEVVGEVQVRGPAVTAGYLRRPAEEQPFTADGWLRTGDAGFVDGDDLFVVGRLTDRVIVRGQNYYPEDVEEVVRAMPGVDRRRCAALSVTHDRHESMLVLVETHQDRPAAERLAARVRAGVVGALGLDAVEVVTVPPRTIPFTSSGKVRRRAARQLYERHECAGQPRALAE
jgi:acyl-CoA synthetase (AMP-forming)/AMP-acid ligase II